MRVVLANGCFDIFHAGHVRHLAAARRLGDRLVVALTVDEAVNKGPGMPLNPWEERAEVLRACRHVDEVVRSRGAEAAIYIVRPQVFVKGIDYSGRALQGVVAACRAVGAEFVTTSTDKMGSGEIFRRYEKCGF